MTTLYAVVTGANYDEDATIHGIYTTRDMAEEAMKRYGADRIEEQQADVLPELPEGKYAWAVSIMGDRITPRHKNVDGELRQSRADERSGIVYCRARDEAEAIEIALRDLPALLEQARKDAEKAAAKMQEDIIAGRVLRVTREMILNDATGMTLGARKPTGMLGSMWGKRQ